jgi:ATP-binding cassette subfamily C (CFTR/MRP) protein 1
MEAIEKRISNKAMYPVLNFNALIASSIYLLLSPAKQKYQASGAQQLHLPTRPSPTAQRNESRIPLPYHYSVRHCVRYAPSIPSKVLPMLSVLGYAPLLFCPVVAFAAFRTISQKDEKSLDAARLFTSYSLILLIVSPLATLLQSFPRLASAYDCMRRIQAYLVAEEQHDQRHLVLQPVSEKASSIDDQDIISVQDVDIGLEDIEVPILRGLTFKIPPFGLTMVIGPVASGKSTLLKAVLGECVLSRGSISLPNNSIGFCEQTPWLTNATIRENIVGTSDFSPDWYAEVLYACVLQMFSSNDHTVVGSDGVNLSGGQRQRIVSSQLTT